MIEEEFDVVAEDLQVYRLLKIREETPQTTRRKPHVPTVHYRYETDDGQPVRHISGDEFEIVQTTPTPNIKVTRP